MERARRSMRVTTRLSPLPMKSRMIASSDRPAVVVPDTFSNFDYCGPASTSQ